MRTCAICEASFDPKGTSRKFCGNSHTKVCEGCGNTFIVKNNHRYAATRSCSPSCRSKLSHSAEAREKREANSLARYGVPRPQQRKEVKEKARATNRRRYGADHPNQNAEVRAKGYATNKERYGVEHPLQDPAIRQRAADSLEKNHGVRHPSLSPELRSKAEDSIEARFGVRHSWQADEVKEKIKQVYLSRYGVEYPSQVPEIREKALLTFEEGLASGRNVKSRRVSKGNLRIGALVEREFAGKTVTYEFTLAGRSFDLAVDGTNVLIEVNPTASHNSKFSFACLINGCPLPCPNGHDPIPNDYHYRRALLAREHGYSLVQIYDWDSEEQVRRLLAGKLQAGLTRYSARKLEKVKLTQRVANAFLRTAHAQGALNKQSHCYGLKTPEGELIAVATFGSSRFGAKEEFEWLRYAVAPGVLVHGGAHALWREFVRDANPSSAISYVDFDHSSAPHLFLEQCGFVEGAPTGPALAWSKEDRRVYNNSLLRLGADRLLGTSYGRPEECGLNNADIMVLEGWLPVFTSGNRVFRWTRS